MEIEVQHRIITGEEARKELESLFSKLSEFDALRAHFLLDALAKEVQRLEQSLRDTIAEQAAEIARLRERVRVLGEALEQGLHSDCPTWMLADSQTLWHLARAALANKEPRP